MFDSYKDNYKTPTIDIFNNGEQWFLIEQDKDILKSRRTELELTQQEVADKARIQLRQYQRFENGERSFSSASMRIGLSICSVLDLDPYRLVPVNQYNSPQE